MIAFDRSHCASKSSSSCFSGASGIMSASSGNDSSNCGFSADEAFRNSTSNQQCSVQRMCETSPATVIIGDVGSTTRFSSASASPSHFHRTSARC